MIEIPASEDDVVGGVLRPPRPLTVGRRKSDRWMARTMGVAFVVLIAFVIYMTFRMAEIAAAVQSCKR